MDFSDLDCTFYNPETLDWNQLLPVSFNLHFVLAMTCNDNIETGSDVYIDLWFQSFSSSEGPLHFFPGSFRV